MSPALLCSAFADWGLLRAAVITLYGYYDGTLGYGCNESVSNDVCSFTAQARGACFASLLILLMGGPALSTMQASSLIALIVVHAITCKHSTKSILQMNLWDNRTLLAAAGLLALSVFPVV